MEAEMEVPQVGILLIALLYQKSPFLRTGFLSCLRKFCKKKLRKNIDESLTTESDQLRGDVGCSGLRFPLHFLAKLAGGDIFLLSEARDKMAGG